MDFNQIMKNSLEPSPLEGSKLDELLEKVKQRDNCFTHEEILQLPEGIKVRIKKSGVHKMFSERGHLVFQTLGMLEDDENLYGIVILNPNRICFDFEAKDYEVISTEKKDRYLVDKTR
jgi:hypothetical protein